ncbi:PREDICTED: zinc finger protein 425-like [Nicrophorus vespilloides]|uniref:Zinc finger protein 425-like n=1 Tax=Nicrophorus vespilloides TaxID=110193 RepID=A0ABM1N9I7_NICVS|nr:PREDICTED: zinc finger protein 425-like [Nicrophorus vespilloides]
MEIPMNLLKMSHSKQVEDGRGFYVNDQNRYECLKCGYSYVHRTHLSRHMKYECALLLADGRATKDGQFYCTKCSKCYKYKQNLLRHVKFECGKEPSFFCQFCSYRAKQMCSVKKHIKLIHGFLGKYRCPKCPKLYKYYTSLYSHLKYVCGKEANLKCPIADCPFKTKLKGTLKMHVFLKHHVSI